MQRAAPQLSLFADDGSPVSRAAQKPPDFAVRESKRARRLSIKVHPRGRVEVVVPRRTRPADVAAFVAENRDWIARAKAEMAEHAPIESLALPISVELPAIDETFRIEYRRRADLDTVHWRQRGNTVRLSGAIHDDAHCLAALKRWLASVARRTFEPRVAELAGLTGLEYRRIQVRAQRTCWGSRSCSGTLSLNLCLLFLRPALLRYLLVHELCHGRHMNHSRRFWALVERHEPDYRRLDRELGESWRDVPAWMGVV